MKCGYTIFMIPIFRREDRQTGRRRERDDQGCSPCSSRQTRLLEYIEDMFTSYLY